MCITKLICGYLSITKKCGSKQIETIYETLFAVGRNFFKMEKRNNSVPTKSVLEGNPFKFPVFEASDSHFETIYRGSNFFFEFLQIYVFYFLFGIFKPMPHVLSH